MNARAVVALAMLLVACRSSSSESAKPAPATVPPIEAPKELGPIRDQAMRDANHLVEVAQKLERAVLARDRDRSRSLGLELRRAFRRVEPVACVLAPVGSSQLDVEDADEGGGDEPTDVGLPVLAALLANEPVDFEKAKAVAAHALRSARVIKTELSTARFHAHAVGQGLSRTLFEWGRRLDGSAAQTPPDATVDVQASGASLVVFSNSFASLLPKPEASQRARLRAATDAFARYLSAGGARERNKLQGLRVSGELGGEIRAAAVALGGSARPPFYPRQRTRPEAYREPITIATFPAWLTSPPDVEKVALGADLFSDTRLSRNQKMSCATCHDPSRGLSSGNRRPVKVNGSRLTRDVPSLYNATFEPMLFWDGRASTLQEQAGIAILDDMSGDWPEIVRRLSADAAYVERFRKAFPEGISSGSVRAAIQEFERTLISDETPFDRYVRGDDAALDGELLAGFDLYFGKARCSRCHRLPLTSGALAPRFKRTPVNVIGVPVAPLAKKLDADLGRGGVTKKDADRFAFKTPSLRNLAVTAPYFHNGAFKTLGEVVDFYAKGSGLGLGLDIEMDPDAGPFEIDPSEKKALVAFLTRGLRDAVVAPEPTPKPR